MLDHEIEECFRTVTDIARQAGEVCKSFILGDNKSHCTYTVTMLELASSVSLEAWHENPDIVEKNTSHR